MYLFRAIAISAALGGALLTGCASTKPNAYQELASASRLVPVNDGSNQFEYMNPNADLRHYANLILDPVTIYTGGDKTEIVDSSKRFALGGT
jgi:ABC-type oligopeptide transport system substrate-binding subunit